MHLGYGNLFAFYYAINLARQLSQYLYSLQNWDAPTKTLCWRQHSSNPSSKVISNPVTSSGQSPRVPPELI